MKTIIVGALSTVFAVSAFAMTGGDACAKPSQKYTCSDMKDGYQIVFTVFNQKPWGQKISATLKKKGKRSMELVAELPCFRKAPERRAPDKAEPVVECYDPMTVDSGFRVTQTTPDFAGVTWASVSQISIAGAQELVKVPCIKK